MRSREKSERIPLEMLKFLGFGELKTWLDCIGRYLNEDTNSLILKSDGYINIVLYTDYNKYNITARIPFGKDTGYLGCTCSNRRERFNEDWVRGNDLHDGRYNIETWIGILGDIVSTELTRDN